MRAHTRWGHINILCEEKVLERTSYLAFVSASVPAQIAFKIEAPGETQTPPPFPCCSHFSSENRGTTRQPHGAKRFGERVSADKASKVYLNFKAGRGEWGCPRTSLVGLDSPSRREDSPAVRRTLMHIFPSLPSTSGRLLPPADDVQITNLNKTFR